MEQSAFEAVMTGVNSFIFVICLSFGIILMTNVLDMVEIANVSTVNASSGSLINSVGQVEERIVEGKDLLTYYRKIDAGVYRYYVKLPDITTLVSLKEYIEDKNNELKTYYNLKYKVVYNGTEIEETKDELGNVTSEKTYQVYVFERQ